MKPFLSLMAVLLSATSLAAQENVNSEQAQFATETVVEGLSRPWGIAFMPDGAMLVTEKTGQLRMVTRDGQKSEPITGLPEITVGEQGGLLDVTLHPNFAQNRLVYLSFTEPGDGGNSTAVASGVLSDDAKSLTDVKTLFSQKPKVDNLMHYGSRVVLDGQGHIFITLGERFEDQYRTQAQELDSHIGKIIRINEDGSVPQDNPYVNEQGALPEIYSIGHRNVQAAAMNPETNVLWEIEHGPKGGDEINIVEPAKNYGWPVVSYGVDYDGSPVGEEGKTEGPNLTQPIKQWTPVIAPSGMIFYTGDAFPEWKGDLFVGGLKVRSLVRVELNGNEVEGEERLLTDLGWRIRDVAQSPDGLIYVITDDDNGRIVRIKPAGGSVSQ
jgi:aldose sugar dehydrogenase